MENYEIKELDEALYTQRTYGEIRKSIVIKITDSSIVFEDGARISVTDKHKNGNIYIINKKMNWNGMSF